MAASNRIGIVGTGNVGTALGGTLVNAGFEVRYGVRNQSAMEKLPRAITAVPMGKLGPWADVVFLAVPASAAVDAAVALGDMQGKVLVDCTNPIRWENGPVWNAPPQGSTAAAIQQSLPDVPIVKAFNTFGAESHANPRVNGTPVDVLMASDGINAKEVVAAIAATAGFRPIDAGPLRNAALLENLAVLWVHMASATPTGRQFVFQMTHKQG
ncbi:MAG: hypothetical protein FJ317_00435 [SAR202 cluster bacterium]|nr:hypothetical protein [SAR202 cluster bacterium]